MQTHEAEPTPHAFAPDHAFWLWVAVAFGSLFAGMIA